MTVRDARLPDDEPAILAFIAGLQDYEARFEPNRRRDPAFAAEHWRDLQERCAEKHGHMAIAEDIVADVGPKPVGWAFAYEQHGELFVHAPERRHGFLAEIYVVPEARRTGHGRALIAACEAWSRGRGHKLMTIGVLAKNAGALRTYAGAGYQPYTSLLRKYL